VNYIAIEAKYCGVLVATVATSLPALFYNNRHQETWAFRPWFGWR